MSKRKKAKHQVRVTVDVGDSPSDLRLAVVRLRALADRLLELAEQAEAAIG